LTTDTRSIGGVTFDQPSYLNNSASFGITDYEIPIQPGSQFGEHGVTTQASIIAICMPATIGAGYNTDLWADDISIMCPAVMDEYGGSTSPSTPDGWTVEECKYGANSYQGALEVGMGHTDLLGRMLQLGFSVFPLALRSAEGIGTTNNSNVRLKPNRLRTSFTNYDIYHSHTFNDARVHGIYGSGYSGKILRGKPSDWLSPSGGTPGWYDVTGTNALTESLHIEGILTEYPLWGEASQSLGPVPNAWSKPWPLQNLHSDGAYYSDTGMGRLWDHYATQLGISSTFGTDMFSARPMAGKWSFWFFCPRTETLSPVWYNPAGCPNGSTTGMAVHANLSSWYPDNWAGSSPSTSGFYLPLPSDQAWDQTDSDVASDGKPLFRGINAYSDQRYSMHWIRPLWEYKFMTYHYVIQPLSFALFNGSQPSDITLGFHSNNAQPAPYGQLCMGGSLSHPVSKRSTTDILNDAQYGNLTVAWDNVVGVDSIHGQLGYGTQTDNTFDQFYVTNGSMQLMRFDTSGFRGEAYTTALTSSNGVWDINMDGKVVQRFITSADQMLKVYHNGDNIQCDYLIGTGLGFTRTGSNTDGAPVGTIAKTQFFNVLSASDDALVKSYGWAFAINGAVTNEYSLPNYN